MTPHSPTFTTSLLHQNDITPVPQGDVTITYNKLHADPRQGKTLDIVLKSVKHRLVERMSASTADALGLSRAILCNDSLVRNDSGENTNS